MKRLLPLLLLPALARASLFATGGTETVLGDNTVVHAFTNAAAAETFTLSQPKSVRILVVGGGGGVIDDSAYQLAAGTYTITLGDQPAGGPLGAALAPGWRAQRAAHPGHGNGRHPRGLLETPRHRPPPGSGLGRRRGDQGAQVTNLSYTPARNRACARDGTGVNFRRSSVLPAPRGRASPPALEKRKVTPK